MSVIAAVIDRKTEKVVNSAYVRLSGVSTVEQPSSFGRIRIVREGNIIRAEATDGIVGMTLFSANGAIAARCGNDRSMDISGCGKGLYIVRVTTAAKTYHYKQIL